MNRETNSSQRELHNVKRLQTMPTFHEVSRRQFLRSASAGVLGCGAAATFLAAAANSERPPIVTPRGILCSSQKGMQLRVPSTPAVRLAASKVKRVLELELKCKTDLIYSRETMQHVAVTGILCSDNIASSDKDLLKQSSIALDSKGRIAALVNRVGGEQGFAAAWLFDNSSERLVLAANTEIGLNNALLTLSDRLYLDHKGNVSVYSLDGISRPALPESEIITDLYSPDLRMALEYWDFTTNDGVDEFADWFASFRFPSYGLIMSARGWGMTYPSERFPVLSDPTHPNCKREVFPQLIERFHKWGMKVTGAGIYMRSGFSMELAACPEMAAPNANLSKIHPFKAGKGDWVQFCSDMNNAIVCMSSSAAKKYYSDLVIDILERYPTLDRLSFHIGHGIHGLCNCPQCKGLKGNRDAIHGCFAHVYDVAQKKSPGIQLTVPAKIFGDATRKIVENLKEFPHVKLDCTTRWLGVYRMEEVGVPVMQAGEDGANGTLGVRCGKQKGRYESWMPDPDKTIADVRKYYRDYEPWLKIYSQRSCLFGIPGIVWNPHVHKEIENLFFLYSQLVWEPDITWHEFAKRYVIRAERRIDEALADAYCSAIEANDAITFFGVPFDADGHFALGTGSFVFQEKRFYELKTVGDKIDALRENIKRLGIRDYPLSEPPVSFDLRWSLLKTLTRLEAKETLIWAH